MKLSPWRMTSSVFLAVLVVLVLSSCAEATFLLAPDSRLPRWVELPQGVARADVALNMSTYIGPFGRSATFTARESRGRWFDRWVGEKRGLYPLKLKEPQFGFPTGYPSFEVITVNGITEVIEHRRMEPIFYLNDDPAVWAELNAGVPGK
jgi:hypothetical protein